MKVDMFRPLKGEVADQQRFLEDILVQGFDGVVISPINPDAMTELFARVAAKMPLVTTDSDAPKSARKVYVGTNNVEAGKLAGNTAAAALKAAGVSKGKVALFVGRMDMQNAIERKQGIDETLGKVPGHRDPAGVPGPRRPRAGQEERRGRAGPLSRSGAGHGHLVLQRPVHGRRRARFQPQGQADPGRLRRGRGDAEGRPRRAHHATIVQRPFEFGYQSIKALKELRDGKTVPPFVDTGIMAVDKTNLDQFWNELRELKND